MMVHYHHHQLVWWWALFAVVAHHPVGGRDVLASVGLEDVPVASYQALRSRFEHFRPADVSSARASLSKLLACLRAEEASDCILLAHPCVRVFQQMTRYNGGSLGELSCPILLPSEMSGHQTAAIAEHVVGSETYFEWGAGASTENIAPLAERAYTAEHYQPWCACLRARPVSRCLANVTMDAAAGDDDEGRRRRKINNVSAIGGGGDPLAIGGSDNNPATTTEALDRRVACVESKLNLRSFGRLQQNGANNTHKNIADAHRNYVHAIDASREIAFDVILVDGRAHLSCALKALGYTTNASVVFVNDYPRKYGKRLLRYYDLLRTIGWDGDECDTIQPGRCLALLRPKPPFFGNHEVHADFLAQNKNFVRSPVNF